MRCKRCESVMAQRYQEEPHCPRCGYVAWDYASPESQRRTERWNKVAEIAFQAPHRGKFKRGFKGFQKGDNNLEQDLHEAPGCG